LTDGVSTIVYRATRGDECFYLRILPEVDATFAPEVRAHQLARELGCAVPEVLAYEARDPILERSTMLTTEIAGQPLSVEIDVAAARRIVMAAGRDLARINSIPVEGFGWVDRSAQEIESGLRGEHHDLDVLLDGEYRQVLDSLPDDAVPGLPSGELGHGLRAALAAAQCDDPARLVHGDFDTSHIFVAEGSYSGIIDFGEIRGMPDTYDLGHHLMHDRERLPYSTVGWLLEGYREMRPLSETAGDRMRAWSLLIAARALSRGLQRAPDSRIVATARRSLLRTLVDE